MLWATPVCRESFDVPSLTVRGCGIMRATLLTPVVARRIVHKEPSFVTE
jgi:hypothetical protein